jgi:hypothetical protein
LPPSDTGENDELLLNRVRGRWQACDHEQECFAEVEALMAIAKVRISPVERWCESQKLAALHFPQEMALFVGQSVRIDTESMTTEQPSVFCGKPCGGRWWVLTEDCRKEVRKSGVDVGEGICEHMLEMD